jgi:hypothetical protein
MNTTKNPRTKQGKIEGEEEGHLPIVKNQQ